MKELELEKTYLLKYVPEGLKDCKQKEIYDVYIPQSHPHPVLRVRKKGDIFEITKKAPATSGDASEQIEHTIPLLEEEFLSLAKVEGKKLRKIRYFYPIDKYIAEIDVFLDDLEGLAMVDVEFKSVEEKESFVAPDFCSVDITQSKTFAGGLLAGKKYSDVQSDLDGYNYQKISL